MTLLLLLQTFSKNKKRVVPRFLCEKWMDDGNPRVLGNQPYILTSPSKEEEEEEKTIKGSSLIWMSSFPPSPPLNVINESLLSYTE